VKIRSQQRAKEAQKALRIHASQQKAIVLQRFFKTKKGEYGENDRFLGVVVPETRRVAKSFRDLSLPQLKRLLYSQIHEDRLLGLLILVDQYKSEGSLEKQKEIFDFYLQHKKRVNNWDLVDQSSSQIVGAHLMKEKDRDLLDQLARSTNLWDSRIAIVSTYYFIRRNEFSDTLRIAKLLLSHQEDLIHKAVGWMLREVGKRDEAILCRFLDKNGSQMPRTMLRYAIERLAEPKRMFYLKRKQGPKTRHQ
jgi:3-methyladenine DNA glycosylase AlkD